MVVIRKDNYQQETTFFVPLHFQYSIIMASLKDLFHSAAYRAFMKKLLLYALIVLVLGIIFWACKLPGGTVMTIVGGSVLVFWVLFYLFGKIIR